ncbi:hypothetical protein LCGC14_2527640 [marine sediment metagenome]|uniref:Lipoprotein n=1 Tax=marine sediment metagenome TaxID=412755 RepID=A0A0F9D658_9ZZZZ
MILKLHNCILILLITILLSGCQSRKEFVVEHKRSFDVGYAKGYWDAVNRKECRLDTGKEEVYGKNESIIGEE